MRWTAWGVCVCVAGLWACSSSSDGSSSAWRFEDGLDDPAPGIVVPDPVPACAALEVGEVEVLEATRRNDSANPVALPRGGQLLFTEDFNASNGTADAELFAMSPDGAPTQLTNNDVDDELVAVRGDSMLLTRRLDGQPRPLTTMIWRLGDQERPLGVVSSGYAFSIFPLRGPISAHERQLVIAEHALWWRVEESNLYTLVLSSADGRERELVTQRQPTPIAINERAAIWLAFGVGDAPDEVALMTLDVREDNASPVELMRGASRDLRWFKLADEVLWWPQDERLLRVDLDSGDMRDIALESTCKITSSSGARALLVCGDGEEDAILLADAQGLRTLDTREARILTAKADGDLYAFVTGPADEREGVIWAGSLSAVTSAPVRVAQMGVGCDSCGAFWDPAYIALDDGLLVWNYAEPATVFRSSYVGYTQLRCTP